MSEKLKQQLFDAMASCVTDLRIRLKTKEHDVGDIDALLFRLSRDIWKSQIQVLEHKHKEAAK